MILSMSGQIWLWLYCFIFGCLMGLVYDLAFIHRQFTRPTALLSAAEDLIYWVICAVCCFLALLRLCFGELRPFTLTAIFIGLIIYSVFVSPIILSLLKPIIKLILIIIKAIFYFIMLPFNFLVSLISLPIKKIIIFLFKPLQKLIKYEIIQFSKPKAKVTKRGDLANEKKRQGKIKK